MVAVAMQGSTPTPFAPRVVDEHRAMEPVKVPNDRGFDAFAQPGLGFGGGELGPTELPPAA